MQGPPCLISFRRVHLAHLAPLMATLLLSPLAEDTSATGRRAHGRKARRRVLETGTTGCLTLTRRDLTERVDSIIVELVRRHGVVVGSVLVVTILPVHVRALRGAALVRGEVFGPRLEVGVLVVAAVPLVLVRHGVLVQSERETTRETISQIDGDDRLLLCEGNA